MKRTILFLVILCWLGSAFAYQNVVVYQEAGKFCGWPANNGVWIWGNEILVGFDYGVYKYNPDGHSIDPNYPSQMVQARSLDGGVTWTLEKPEALKNGVKYQKSNGAINFTHPDFAMKVRNRKLFYSYNRGKDWEGPVELPAFDQIAINSRTDYVINSQCEALIFTSAAKPDGIEDRPLVIKTANGGRTFEFLSWITDCPPVETGTHSFATMPSTVKLSDTKYITAIRNRIAKRKWIDICESTDGGASWHFLSNPVEGQWNPGSMIKLADGRICLTYGYRSAPIGIRAKISDDNGKTWGSEIILRDGGLGWDMGYPRTVQRPDGKIVTMYYFYTESNPQQHIAATIWQP